MVGKRWMREARVLIYVYKAVDFGGLALPYQINDSFRVGAPE
jgi:hypothetical protein